jgi:hypothetical protein
MTRAYKIEAVVIYEIIVEAHNEDDAFERVDQIPFKEWEMGDVAYDLIETDPEDNYEDASRDD